MGENERIHEPTELRSLADYLQEKQDDILTKWRDLVLEDENNQNSTLISLSQRKFYNDIPEYLEKLRSSFRGDSEALERLPKGHGSHRWRHGIDLREVVQEWKLLSQAVMSHIIQFHESNSLGADSLLEVMDRLTRFFHAGIKVSIDEFYRLQRQEAEGKLQDLERIIVEQDDVTEQRGQNLQRASHDLRGSVTAINTNLFLLSKTDLDDKGEQLITKLSRSVDSLSYMLKELLDLSRLEAGREQLEISEFDVAELLSDLSNSIEPLADEKGLELRSGGDESLVVRGDPLKVQRVAQNLLLNSLEYTEEGYVELNWLTEPDSPDHWELNVRDTGPGFDYTNTVIKAEASSAESSPSNPDNSQTKQNPGPVAKHSEGIGLLIVRQLCDLLNAVLEVKSSPDMGTHFRIVFPTDYSGN